MRHTIGVFAVALGLSVTSAASAQSRPYGGDDQLAPGAAAAANPSSHVYNYPAAEVQAVPPARAAVAVARAVHNREYVSLNSTVRQTVRSFEKSDELSKAVAAEQAAWDEYEKARDAALRELREDPKYQAQVELSNNLKSKIDERRAAATAKDDGDAHDTEIRAMAGLRFDYASAVKARESEALAKNDAVRDARRKLVEARGRVSQLREQFSDEVRTNDDIVAARKSFWDAKINRLGAEAYLHGVIEARTIALNYVSWINKYNKYGQGYNYVGGYPYDYGYGYTMYPYVPR